MINRNDKRPIYDQLVEILRNKIENEMEPNDRMLSERKICDEYGVSRTTVRLAMADLEHMGYIYKRHGKGTFVAALNQNSQNLMDSYSFTDHMKAQGKNPSTKVLSFEIVESTKYFAEKLGINPGEKIIKIMRLRLADNIPMMLERTYLPMREFAGLTQEKVIQKPLYEIFREDYGEIIKVADEEFSAGIVSDKEAELLEVPIDSACLKLLRTTYNDNNIVIEFTLSVARSDKFVYKIRHLR
ncbi:MULTISPECIES: GntR family transcriptional regulator [Romboutsia]|uniref:HTH-type transcriptional repressor YvoA n=1 Tax=Romboutsia hominis TaxID=1507512 RepID=A0A2P2BN14_9FIRM|nr:MULTISPECIES: GntR family transcriptional regulator [Romboutsia]MCH1958535.1 GntR family transcriptional regulator [Romboutsia hominis]MDB8789136.1 GntR family transcriptional regulator [Romboutsia sp. 1001216sp1]MDB8793145.1 GntR family transcriptional regulator [Romboutsia sp. 1001216sp1]MDB8795938.1 GntR family transcriptional regulator [Romboutsia sp. 1001216sp1]MDB8799433.1 GntR family transcriptional regulator [Romboutsia sp. 1001216sp1]